MTRLAAHGVSIDVPAGWEAELSTQPDPSTLDPRRPAAAPLVVLHAANFSLPAERGDYGSGAVEIMGRNGIFAALVEFDGASATTMLFAAEGVPTRLVADASVPTSFRRRCRARPPAAVLSCGVAGVLPLRGDRVALPAGRAGARAQPRPFGFEHRLSNPHAGSLLLLQRLALVQMP